MIVYTIADRIYYDSFWKLFQTTSPLPIELRIVGNFESNFDNTYYEKYEIEDLQKKYNVTKHNAKGYYCLRKWQTIPEDQNSIITDIDVYFTQYFDVQHIEGLLEKYDAVNFARIKSNARVGGQMSIAISRRIAKDINQYSLMLEKKYQMVWDLDKKSKEYLYNNYKTLDLPVCQDVINELTHSTPKDPVGEIQIYKPWMYFARGMAKEYEDRMTFEQKRDSLYEHFRTHNQS